MSRQQERNSSKLKNKEMQAQIKLLNAPLKKGEFIQHIRQIENSIAIIHKFIHDKFGNEYEEFLQNINKEVEDAKAKAAKIEDAANEGVTIEHIIKEDDNEVSK